MEESLGLDELVVLHHVKNHLLSLLLALQCVIVIKSALKKLLQEELPKNNKSTVNNEKYLRSRRLWIQEKLTLKLNSSLA